jgi:hypothetical protein
MKKIREESGWWSTHIKTILHSPLSYHMSLTQIYKDSLEKMEDMVVHPYKDDIALFSY